MTRSRSDLRADRRDDVREETNPLTDLVKPVASEMHPYQIPVRTFAASRGRSTDARATVPKTRTLKLLTEGAPLSAVIPSSVITFPPGALMPNRSIPTTLPSRPTKRYQRTETPASIATRFRQEGGNTSSW